VDRNCSVEIKLTVFLHTIHLKLRIFVEVERKKQVTSYLPVLEPSPIAYKANSGRTATCLSSIYALYAPCVKDILLCTVQSNICKRAEAEKELAFQI
jgi:hypothetical protein